MGIDTDTHNLGIISTDFVKRLLEEGELVLADRRPIGRVKSQDNVLATMIAELELLRIAIEQGEIGRWFVDMRVASTPRYRS